MQELLKMTGFRKAYGKRTIFSISSMTLAAGLHEIRGGNGAGKSTLLRVWAGISPYQGELDFFGESELRKVRQQHRLWVSYLEAEAEYPSYLPGKYLVDMYAQIKGATESQILALAEDLGITAFWNQKMGAYSSGMKKKLGLLLAFMGQPRLVLLDEPYATLDQPSIAIVASWIKRYQAQGTSFAIASHQELEEFMLPDAYRWQVEAQSLSLVQSPTN